MSVVITVRDQNRDDLARTLLSVQGQTLVGSEIIIVDDASTDAETLAWLDEYRSDARIRVLHLTANAGVCGARNAGAAVCAGELLMFLDPGDEISATYLEKSWLMLADRPDADVVFSDVDLVGDRQGVWITHPGTALELMRANGVPGAAVHRSRCFRLVNGFREEMGQGFEDWDYWARLAAAGCTFVRIPEPLFRYVHSEATGRDAAARAVAGELQQRIVQAAMQSTNATNESVASTSPARHPIIRFPAFNPYLSKEAPVVFFLPWFFRRGGADAYVKGLCEFFALQGRTVVVITTHTTSDTPSAREILGVVSYFYQLPLGPELHWQAVVTGILERLHGAAIVVNVGSAWFAERLLEGLLPISPRNVIDIQFNHIGHARTALLLSQHGCRTVSATRFMADVIEGAVPGADTRTIYASTPGSEGSPAQKGERPSRSAQPVTLGWIGRFSAEKDLIFFLNVVDHMPQARAVVVGGGDGSLEAAVSSHPRVDWRRDVDDISSVYDEMDALCITSSIEGIPLIATEALSRGVRVVTRSLPGMYELAAASNGVAVLPLSDDSPGTFARLLSGVLNRSDDCSVHLPEEFTWRACVAEWTKLLEEIQHDRVAS